MKRIFLVGYMGAGKTTVGKKLAKRLNLTFVDLDLYIESRYHKTIPALFSEKGEEGFREIECQMLREVAMFEDVLISTGGGAPCFFDNMSFMTQTGLTVYLNASPAELSKRLETAGHARPVLNGRKGRELIAFVSESLEKRSPYYMQAAIVMEAGALHTEHDVNYVVNELEKKLV